MGDGGSELAAGVDIAGVSVVMALTKLSRRPDRRPRPEISGTAPAHQVGGGWRILKASVGYDICFLLRYCAW